MGTKSEPHYLDKIIALVSFHPGVWKTKSEVNLSYFHIGGLGDNTDLYSWIQSQTLYLRMVSSSYAKYSIAQYVSMCDNTGFKIITEI